MQFETWQALFLMDGHGQYVWPVYILTVSGLIFLVWQARRDKKQLVAELSRRQRREHAKKESTKLSKKEAS